MRAVIFGAGSIGRGFIGELLNRSAFEIVFVDIDKDLLERISDVGGYYVDLIDSDNTKRVFIPVHKAIYGNDIDSVAEEIANCDLIFTAVGINALKFISPSLARGLKERNEKVNIILCENMSDAHVYMHELISEHVSDEVIQRVGFLRASVGRMVPLPGDSADLLIVKAETYAHLPVDGEAVVGSLPWFEGLEIVKPFDYAIERKLFIHNLGHVACAWMGGLKGCTYIWEAISDETVRNNVIKAMQEAANGLAVKYGVDQKEHLVHIEDLINRFANKSLGDTVGRVGRDWKRKLSPSDRVIGALKLCKIYDLPRDGIYEVIAVGLKYCAVNKSSDSCCEIIESKGIKYVLKNFCDIEDDCEVESVMKKYVR